MSARGLHDALFDKARARRAFVEVMLVSFVVTASVSAVATFGFVPPRYVATLVGMLFLGATWLFVWRADDAHVVRSGLALGGLVLPGPIDGVRLAKSVASAIAWALLLAAVTFGPFAMGWRAFWHARGPFAPSLDLWPFVNDVFGQLVIIALPEEAFYRGYVQSRLDDVFPQRVVLLGAHVGPSIVVTSLIFALGHFATVHAPMRLAVFFPSLVFGWLRARTGGIGAGVVFHASCNIFSELLVRGFHLG